MTSETTVATTGKTAEPSKTRTGKENAAALAAARVTEKTPAEKPAVARKPSAKGSSSPKTAGTKTAGSGAAVRPSKSRAGKKKTAATAEARPAAKTRSGAKVRKSGSRTGTNRASRSTRRTTTASKAPPAAAPAVSPELPEGYVPNGDEEYMGPLQTEYFRRKLIDWRQALLDESEQTLESMRDQQREVSDEAERASRETEMSFELRTRDRYRKLIRKINEALGRIEDGSYGFCEETGDPIGLGRLEARPIATLSVEAQERREMLERQYRP